MIVRARYRMEHLPDGTEGLEGLPVKVQGEAPRAGGRVKPTEDGEWVDLEMDVDGEVEAVLGAYVEQPGSIRRVRLAQTPGSAETRSESA